jgi:hypothetical protein
MESRMTARNARIRKSLGVFAVLGSIVCGSVNAGTPLGPYTAYVLRVTALVSLSAGAYVYFDGNHQCGSDRAFIDGTRPDFKTLYATLLAAQTTSTAVSADLRDTSDFGSCNGASSRIANLCMGDAGGPCFTSW